MTIEDAMLGFIIGSVMFLGAFVLPALLVLWRIERKRASAPLSMDQTNG